MVEDRPRRGVLGVIVEVARRHDRRYRRIGRGHAHSALKYVAWRRVTAEDVGARLALPPSRLPRLIGPVSFDVSVAAYEQWLDDTSVTLIELLEQELVSLRDYPA